MMRKRFFICLTCLLSVTSGHGIADGLDFVESSNHQHFLHGKVADLVLKNPDVVKDSDFGGAVFEPIPFEQVIDSAFKQREQYFKESKAARTVLGVVGNTVESASWALASIVPANNQYSFAAKFTLMGAGKLTSYALSSQGDYLSKTLQEKGKRVVIDALDQYRRDHKISIQNLAKLTPEQAFKAINLDGLLSSSKVVKNFSDEERAVFHLNLYQAMNDNLKYIADHGDKALRDQGDRIVTNLGSKIDDYAGQVAQSWQGAKKLFQKNNDLLGAIGKNLGKINNGLQAINQRVIDSANLLEDVSADVFFIRETIFENMSPKQKLAALQRDLIRIDDPVKKEQKIKEIEIVVQKQELYDNVHNFLRGAGDVVEIFSDLGVIDGKTAQVIGTGVAVTSTAFDLVQGVSSLFNADAADLLQGIVNPLSAVKTLVKLFGFGGDAEGARHEQIMNALAGLARGQEQIMKNQKIMVEYLDIINKNIALLSEQMTKQIEMVLKGQEQLLALIRDDLAWYHKDTMEKLDKMHFNINTAIEIVNEILTKDIKQCREFLDSRLLFDEYEGEKIPTYNFEDGEFKSYADLSYHFDNYHNSYQECEKGIRHAFSHGGQSSNYPFSAIFQVAPKSSTNDRGDPIYGFVELYDKMVSFVKKYAHLLNVEEDKVFAALFIPWRDPLTLEDKLTNIKEWQKDYLSSVPEKAIKRPLSLFDKLLDATSVIEYSKDLLGMHYYVQLTNKGKLYPLEVIKEGERGKGHSDYSIVMSGHSYLRFALKLIETTIAEQSLLSGDVVLPIMKKIFNGYFAGDETLTDAYLAALEILKRNKLVASNLMLYLVSTELKRIGASNHNYFVAISSDRDELLRQIFGKGWQLYNNKKGTLKDQEATWLVAFSENFYLPLPSKEVVERKTLQFRFVMDHLQLMLDKVIEEMWDYDHWKRLKESVGEDYKKLVLHAYGRN